MIYEEYKIQAAIDLARHYGLEEEVKKCIEEGFSPEDALIEWDID